MHEILNHWLTHLSAVAPIVFGALSVVAGFGSFYLTRRDTINTRTGFIESTETLDEYADTVATLRRGVLLRPDGAERAEILKELDETDAQLAKWRVELEGLDVRLKRAERWVFLKSSRSTKRRAFEGASGSSATAWFWEALANRDLATNSDASKRASEVAK